MGTPDLKPAPPEQTMCSDMERFQALMMKRSSDFIVAMDLSGRLVFANDAVATALGESPEALIGKTKDIFFAPADSISNAAVMQTVMTGGLWSGIRPLITSAGEERSIDLLIQLVKDEQNRPVGLFALGRDITDRQRTEAALEQSETLRKSIFEASVDAITVTDTEGVIVDCNPAAAAMGDLSVEEVVGRSLFDFIAPTSHDVVAALIKALLGGEPQGRVELEVAGKDGGFVPVETTASVIRDAAGAPRYLLGIYRDITERRSNEQRLTTAHRDLRDIVNSIPSGLFTYRHDRAADELILLDGNPAAARLTGTDPQALRGQTFDAVWPEARAAGITESFLEVARTGEPHTAETIRYKDHRVAGAFRTSAFPMPDRKVGVAFEDITAQVEAVREVKTLAALVENSTDFIGLATPDGQVLYVNAAGQRLAGLAGQEQAQGKRITDFVTEAMQAQLLTEILPRVFAEGAAGGEGTMINFSSGEEREIAYNVFVVTPPDGDEGSILAMVATDISEQRQAARERQRLEEQLRQSLKMEAIGRLAGGVAHDFNNILTGISGFADLIMTSIDSRDAIYEDVEEIRIAAGRAAELTNQLLAFSRKQLVAPRVVRPNDVVASSERMLARIIGEDVLLRFEPDPEAGVITIDPVQLDQILVNLSVNARDAMPGGGALTIRTAQVVLDGERSEEQPPMSGPYVALSVTDTGHGMDQETRQHIFEPFFSTRGAGTGLGLSTIYGIVKQNAGRIEVSSQPGQGTTFTIFFPAVQEPVAPSPAAAAALTGGSEVVLLVEDEKMVRRLAKRILEQQGYEVIAADSGDHALQLCAQREGAIDLLLTDVVMPEMNGRELCELLRERLPGLRTLYMSGYTDDIIADSGVLSEGTSLIKKPFTVEELAGKVREVLNRAPGAPAPG